MRPALRNDPFVEDVNRVAVDDGAETMSNGESCSAFRLRKGCEKELIEREDWRTHHFAKTLLNGALVRRVQRRRRLRKPKSVPEPSQKLKHPPRQAAGSADS